MFWQKSLVFLGVLATIGEAVPFTIPTEDSRASLFKRNLNDPSGEFLVF